MLATTCQRRSSRRRWRALPLAALLLSGCATFAPEVPPDTRGMTPPRAPRTARATTVPPLQVVQPPVATHTFAFDPKTTGVVGQLQVTRARHEDTLPDIARRFNLGYEEVARANPGVDPWLPGEGTRILLPTQFVLPDAPREGVVVNLAALRLFYFPKPGKDGRRVVMTAPIGIGKVGWATPEGTTTVVSKRKSPWWTPPVSVRKEHETKGDPLPARVPPGPDNPLGAYAMNLGWPSYLIHGTNKPAGVGLRASHGCIRMYPEDIAVLFGHIAIGTPVTVVNQPLLYRWQGDNLYVQSYPPHEPPGAAAAAAGDDEAEEVAGPPSVPFDDALANRLLQAVKPHGGTLNWDLAKRVVTQAQGMAVPVSRRGLTMERYVASARLVENALPGGANWDGRDGETPVDTTASGHNAGR
jgi:L,D-transpeptidase ErfK/SrfK